MLSRLLNRNIKNPNFNKILTSSLIHQLLLILVTLLVYSKTLDRTSLFPIDDSFLINPLIKIDNFFNDYKKAEVLDYQPLRDFSFYIDIQILKKFEFHSFRLTNILIFALLILCTYKLVRNILGPLYALSLSLLIVCHPLFSFVLIWISTRKHLLASLFALIALNISYRKKQEISSFLKYTLSISLSFFSQPIHLWLPFFNLAKTFYISRRKKAFQFITYTVSISIAFLVGYINISFYYGNKSPYGNNVGGRYDLEYVSKFLLQHGRYFYNSLIPSNLEIYYSESSFLNIIGMFLLFAYLYVSFKISRKAFEFIVLALLSVSLVTFHRVGTFISDSYSILYTTFTWISLTIVLNKIIKKEHVVILIIVVITTLNLSLNLKRNQELSNDLTYIEKNVNEEYNEQAMNYYLHLMAMDGQAHKAIQIFDKYYDILSDGGGTISPRFIALLAKEIYLSKDFYIEQKIRLIVRYLDLPGPYMSQYLALLLYQTGRFNDAYTSALNSVHRLHFTDYEKYSFTSLFYNFCLETGPSGCEFIYYNSIKRLKLTDELKITDSLNELSAFFDEYRNKDNHEQTSKKFYFRFSDIFEDINNILFPKTPDLSMYSRLKN